METQPKEPIKWRVLSVNGDDAFLLADKNLDSRPYNEINEAVPKTTVRIKVGSKAYKKATVKGRKFTLKFNYRLKNTKVIVKVTKKGYKDFVRSFKVK